MLKELLALVMLGHALVATAAGAIAPPWAAEPGAAFARARRSSRPVLAFFTQPQDCPACALLEAAVLSQPDFLAAATNRFVLLRVDCSQSASGAEGAALADRAGVRFSPAVLALDPVTRECVGRLDVHERDLKRLTAALGPLGELAGGYAQAMAEVEREFGRHVRVCREQLDVASGAPGVASRLEPVLEAHVRKVARAAVPGRYEGARALILAEMRRDLDYVKDLGRLDAACAPETPAGEGKGEQVK